MLGVRELEPENQCGQHPGVLPPGLASSPRVSSPPHRLRPGPRGLRIAQGSARHAQEAVHAQTPATTPSFVCS